VGVGVCMQIMRLQACCEFLSSNQRRVHKTNVTFMAQRFVSFSYVA